MRTVYIHGEQTQRSSVVSQKPHGADMNVSADDYIKSFIDEIEVMNNIDISLKPTTDGKKRKRAAAPIDMETKKPGWVPKPSDDCPIVSWQEDGNTFAVQNPGNKGQMLLKIGLYESADMSFMCGLFLDKGTEMYECVKQLVDKLENIWIDKSSGVPKITGLTQTVTQYSTVSKPPKKRVVRKK